MRIDVPRAKARAYRRGMASPGDRADWRHVTVTPGEEPDGVGKRQKGEMASTRPARGQLYQRPRRTSYVTV